MEGYGLSLKAVDEFCKQGAKLIITLDCGVTNVKEVEKANSLGLDVIIVDHHIVPENPPKSLRHSGFEAKRRNISDEIFERSGDSF